MGQLFSAVDSTYAAPTSKAYINWNPAPKTKGDHIAGPSEKG